MSNEAKTCKVCGRLLPLNRFPEYPFNSGLSDTCIECVANTSEFSEWLACKKYSAGISNKKFEGITDSEIIDELNARGYKMDNKAETTKKGYEVMTIQEVSERKMQLEKKIHQMLAEFEKETMIRINRISYENYNNPLSKFNREVSIEITI